MNISPLRAAIIAAIVISALAVIALRPAQLVVHPRVESTVLVPPAAAPSPPIRTRARPLVYVAGAVMHPGVYAMPDDARARDALALAGGATHDADLVAVNLAAHVGDGDEVAVPRVGDPPAVKPRASRRRAASGSHRRRPHPRTNVARDTPATVANGAEPLVDINAADADALADLPGVGPALAQRIVDFRELNGPFASIDGLADVAGITPAHLAELEPLVTVAR